MQRKETNTVKLVQDGHSRDLTKVAVLDEWPSYASYTQAKLSPIKQRKSNLIIRLGKQPGRRSTRLGDMDNAVYEASKSLFFNHTKPESTHYHLGSFVIY